MLKRIIVLFLLILSTLTACNSQSTPDPLEQELSRIETALGNDYQKLSETEVHSFPFTNGESGELVYYLCLTTYFVDAPTEVTSLDFNALSAVFDPDSARQEEEFNVSGHPAAFFHTDTHTWLCCTTSPETTILLQYTPGTITTEDALKIFRSVFEKPE